MAGGRGLTGTPVDRVDGRLKVRGEARYAADAAAANVAYGVLVGSAVPRGRVTRLDPRAAEEAPGVRLVLTHANRGTLGDLPKGGGSAGWTPESRPPLADDRVHYAGQYVAMVVADTLEEARHAASLLAIDYEPEPFTVSIDDALATGYRPARVFDEDLSTSRGSVEEDLAAAPVRLDLTYVSPNEHPCPMEPHATVAAWSGDTLTVHDSTQWVQGDQAVLAAAFGLPRDRVRVLAPFVGGMFGSKVATGAHTLLAALASRRLGRPVKVVLERPQVLTTVGHRTETVQRVEIGAAADGTLLALRHRTRAHAGAAEAGNAHEFHEPTSAASRLLYACPSFAAEHEAVRLDVMPPAWMRAPGEAPGLWALESAMDELAYALAMDPLELRRRNHAEVDPHHGLNWSSKHLLACYERGAERFGWAERARAPGSTRDGGALVGVGMATATHPGWLMGATVRVRLERDGGGVHAVVSTAGSDVGTGLYTVMALTAADGLGLPIDRVTAEAGDSSLPPCALAGGSNLTASTAPAIADACRAIRSRLLAFASGAMPGFERAAERPDAFLFADGRLALRSAPTRGLAYADLMARGQQGSLSAEATTAPRRGRDARFAFQSFGAHFVAVRVDPDLARVRVSRIVSVFDVGRVLNAKATRSQLVGAIVFGIGQALYEALTYDRAHGQAVNADLGGYLVPVNADVPDVEVDWIGEPDLSFNTVGCRGVGEIGITGLAAAIANAVYHATGVRVRELPITPERLLRGGLTRGA